MRSNYNGNVPLIIPFHRNLVPQLFTVVSMPPSHPRHRCAAVGSTSPRPPSHRSRRGRRRIHPAAAIVTSTPPRPPSHPPRCHCFCRIHGVLSRPACDAACREKKEMRAMRKRTRKKTKIPSHLYTASINLALPRGTRLYQPFGGARWMAKIRYRAGSRTLKISHNFIFFKKKHIHKGFGD